MRPRYFSFSLTGQLVPGNNSKEFLLLRIYILSLVASVVFGIALLRFANRSGLQ